MRTFPKVVANFNYTGPSGRLRNRLNGAAFDAIRGEYLLLRSGVELAEKVKIIEFGDTRWEYYPKVVTTRDFVSSEAAMIFAARSNVVSTIQSTLINEGATNISMYVPQWSV